MPTSDDELRATIARLRELEFWCKYHRGTYTQIDVPDMTALLDAAERAQDAYDNALEVAALLADNALQANLAAAIRALKEPKP